MKLVASSEDLDLVAVQVTTVVRLAGFVGITLFAEPDETLTKLLLDDDLVDVATRGESFLEVGLGEVLGEIRDGDLVAVLLLHLAGRSQLGTDTGGSERITLTVRRRAARRGIPAAIVSRAPFAVRVATRLGSPIIVTLAFAFALAYFIFWKQD